MSLERPLFPCDSGPHLGLRQLGHKLAKLSLVEFPERLGTHIPQRTERQCQASAVSSGSSAMATASYRPTVR